MVNIISTNQELTYLILNMLFSTKKGNFSLQNVNYCKITKCLCLAQNSYYIHTKFDGIQETIVFFQFLSEQHLQLPVKTSHNLNRVDLF